MKTHTGHRTKHWRLTTLIAFLLLASFILLLFVAISLPVFKPIYLLSVHTSAAADQPATSIATELRFGVWGFCATSVLNVPTIFTNTGECTKPRLGYDVNESILELTGQPQLIQAVLEGLTAVLILHPISAGLALLTLLPGLFLGSHPLSILALVLCIVTALVTTVSCAVDIALVAVAKNKIPSLTSGLFEVAFGNAPWITLAAVVLTWVAVVLLSAVVCECCGLRRGERRSRNDSSDDTMTETQNGYNARSQLSS